MALITCIECGKAFSDKAHACPNCGCPIEHMESLDTTIDKADADELRASFKDKVETISDTADVDNNENSFEGYEFGYRENPDIKKPHVNDARWVNIGDDVQSTANKDIASKDTLQTCKDNAKKSLEKLGVSTEDIKSKAVSIKAKVVGAVEDIKGQSNKAKEIPHTDTPIAEVSKPKFKTGIKSKQKSITESKPIEYSPKPANKKTVKTDNSKNKKVLIIAGAAVGVLVLICILISLIGSVGQNDDVAHEMHTFEWNSVELGGLLPKPPSNKGEVNRNSDESLSIDIYEISDSRYKDYIQKCKGKGFMNDTIEEGNIITSYNSDGYCLALEYDTASNKMLLNLDAPMKMEEINLDDYELLKQLPAPPSSRGNIEQNTDEQLIIYFGDVPFAEYELYVTSCKESGFANDASEEDNKYTAENEEGYLLTAEYISYNILKISIKVPFYSVSVKTICSENAFMNQYDVNVIINDEYMETISHGGQETYNFTLKEGTYNIEVCNAEDESIKGTKEFEVKNDTQIKCNIKCRSEKIDLTITYGKNPPIDKSEYASMKYDAVVKAFEDAGFTNVATKPICKLEKDELNKSGLVSNITIGKNKSYSKDEQFFPDAKVVVKYYAGKKISCPGGKSTYKNKNYSNAVQDYKNAGFVNVSAVIYDGKYGSSVRNGQIKEISVGGETWIIDGEKYPLDAPVVIKYYSIQYLPYSADKMINDLNDNALRSEETYLNKYVEVTGIVDYIDSSGYFVVRSTNEWIWQQITCRKAPSELKEKVKNLSKGDTITVKGRVSFVEEITGYELQVHDME